MSKTVNSRNIKKGLAYLKKKGFKGFAEKAFSKIRQGREMLDYMEWRKYVTLPDDQIERQRSAWKDLAFKNGKAPVFSIVIPAYNTDREMLKILYDSIRTQTYPLFEVIISDGSTDGNTNVSEVTAKYTAEDERFKYAKVEKNLGISGNTNFGLEKATGDFIALCDHDDMLPPWALFSIAEAISKNPGAEFIYTDEDKIDTDGVTYFQPYFKSDFNPDLLCTNNYICHFSAFSRKLQKKVGTFSSEYDGAQDFDYFLRCTEELEKEENIKLEKYRNALISTKDTKELAAMSGLLEESVEKLLEGRFISEKIIHIPMVCYHWKCYEGSTSLSSEAKPYANRAGAEAIKAHYDRVGISFKDVFAPDENLFIYRTAFREPDENCPLVSIIIPNKDNIPMLDRCLRSIIEKSTYRNLEIIVVENNSAEPQTFDYYEKINNNTEYFNVHDCKNIVIKVVYYNAAFNFSAVNNYGFKYSTGDYILLLNNDTELAEPDSINEMYNYVRRENTAIAGAKLVYKDGTIQHGGVIIGHGGVAGEAYKNSKDNENTYMNKLQCAQNYSAVTGACMMVKREVFERLNGLDENFAVAFNDMDFCLRARRLGYLVTYTPYAKFCHYESKTRGSDMTAENLERLKKETELFLDRWGKILEESDPYYNPNLSLKPGHFGPRLLPDEKIGEPVDCMAFFK